MQKGFRSPIRLERIELRVATVDAIKLRKQQAQTMRKGQLVEALDLDPKFFLLTKGSRCIYSPLSRWNMGYTGILL